MQGRDKSSVSTDDFEEEYNGVKSIRTFSEFHVHYHTNPGHSPTSNGQQTNQ